jgi:hypothetical protein
MIGVRKTTNKAHTYRQGVMASMYRLDYSRVQDAAGKQQA